MGQLGGVGTPRPSIPDRTNPETVAARSAATESTRGSGRQWSYESQCKDGSRHFGEGALGYLTSDSSESVMEQSLTTLPSVV